MFLILLLRRIWQRIIKYTRPLPEDRTLMLHRYSHYHGMMIMEPLEHVACGGTDER